MILPLAAAAVLHAPSGACASPRHAQARAVVEQAVGDTARSWTAAFARKGMSYVAPRTIYLCTAVGHPARGSGYAAPVGLVIDLDDIGSLHQVLGEDAPGMIALLVAHEMGHHVQKLTNPPTGASRSGSGRVREAQADCYAGWSLKLSPPSEGGPGATPGKLRVRLSRTLQVLHALQSGGVTLLRDAPPATSHGELSDRVDAVEKGYASADPWRC